MILRDSPAGAGQFRSPMIARIRVEPLLQGVRRQAQSLPPGRPLDGFQIEPAALAAEIGKLSGPKIVIAQAGQINTGAFDPFAEIAAIAKAHGAWLHVDGAFGLWARATPAERTPESGASKSSVAPRTT